MLPGAEQAHMHCSNASCLHANYIHKDLTSTRYFNMLHMHMMTVHTSMNSHFHMHCAFKEKRRMIENIANAYE